MKGTVIQRGETMTGGPEGLVRSVGRRVEVEIASTIRPLVGAETARQLGEGKMLRTRLAARLACCGAVAVDAQVVEAACAGAELLHVATLCHDDVVDGASRRRGGPALWRRTGASGAILIGDLLLSAAFRHVAETNGELVRAFAAAVMETAAAEAEQELEALGSAFDEQRWLRLARSMTGPMFGFPARAATGQDVPLSAAAREAGYLIGTAYQLADDLLDVLGSSGAAGKTLGTDARRGKPVPPEMGHDGGESVRMHVLRLCRSATAALDGWPKARTAVGRFLSEDLQPVLDRHMPAATASRFHVGLRTHA
jgi:geranylgeranyl pyrophosphate synthase